MTKKSQPRDSSLPGYRDDPDAVSLNTNPEEHDLFRDDDVGPSASSSGTSGYSDELPTYEASEAIESTSRENDIRANAVRAIDDHYAVINLPESQRSTSQFLGKKGTSKEVSARLDDRLSDPEELYKYVSSYLQWAPPRPVLWVTGYHYVTRDKKKSKDKRERVNDFEIMLSLQQYLGNASDPEWRRLQVSGPADKVFRGSWRIQRAPGVKSDLTVGAEEEAQNTSDLRAWCDAYSENRSKVKIFRVSRTVSGLDRESLKEWVKTAVRATNYCGHLEIDFVTEDRAVDIYSEHWINRIRTGWMRYIFYFTFLWIFTWPLVFFMTRRWRVVTVDWPFSVPWPERGPEARKYASVSEREWFVKHEELLKSLVMEKFVGNATNIPLDLSRRGRVGGAPGAPGIGNPNLDGAVSFIQAGVRGYNVLRNTVHGRGGLDWGFDE